MTNIASFVEAAEPMRGWVFSDLSVYEAGDIPTLYVQFDNRSPEAVKGYYANAEQMNIFPCDLIQVFKDDQKLSLARSNEYHPRPNAETSIHSGGTLTLEVKLDHICKLPADTVGRYRVQLMADYYHGHVAGEEIEFEIRPTTRRTSVEQLLQGADWQTNMGDELSPQQRLGLAAVTRQKDAAPGLRTRAMRVLAKQSQGEALITLIAPLIVDPDPMVALATISAISAVPTGELAIALVGALDHRDLGVRRSAAKRLVRTSLLDEERKRVVAIAEATEDELLRQFLDQVLADQRGSQSKSDR